MRLAPVRGRAFARPRCARAPGTPPVPVGLAAVPFAPVRARRAVRLVPGGARFRTVPSARAPGRASRPVRACAPARSCPVRALCRAARPVRARRFRPLPSGPRPGRSASPLCGRGLPPCPCRACGGPCPPFRPGSGAGPWRSSSSGPPPPCPVPDRSARSAGPRFRTVPAGRGRRLSFPSRAARRCRGPGAGPWFGEGRGGGRGRGGLAVAPSDGVIFGPRHRPGVPGT